LFARLSEKFILPYARAVKYGTLKYRADRRVLSQRLGAGNYDSAQCAFLVGCGRSGSTVIGKILGKLPQVCYFREPYHIWAAIDPISDVLNLFETIEGVQMLRQQHCTAEAKRRFNALLLEPAIQRAARIMLEKTPQNAMRIGYLEAMRPGSKYIHLIRDGVDVARSIEFLSNDDTYKIAGKPTLNRWWGCSDSRWRALARDGSSAGYFADELPGVNTYLARGAYEWLVTLEEMNRWTAPLGDRLLEITYPFAATQPAAALRRIGDFLGIIVPDNCVKYAQRLMNQLRINNGNEVILPPRMCARFNEFQEQYGFPGRASPRPVRQSAGQAS
jgi:hypothetical protein